MHADALGSIAALTDPGGNIREEVLYEVYGNPVFIFGQNASTVSNSQSPYAFWGAPFDVDVSLLIPNRRQVDIFAGRFLEKDNTWQGTRFSLAFENPIRYRDPTGRSPEDDDSHAPSRPEVPPFDVVHSIGSCDSILPWRWQISSVINGPTVVANGVKYDPKVFRKGFNEPRRHGFPLSFDPLILDQTPTTLPDGARLYRLKGSLVEGPIGRGHVVDGHFALIVDLTGRVTHRFFEELGSR